MDIASYIGGQLNDEQKVAALHTSTSSLILAGAGSGKTRVLTYKIAYLVFGCHIALENIFAVTFTNKAAKEMKERLEVIAQDVQAQTGATSTAHHNFQWIGTFHGMFLRILKRDITKTDRGFTNDFVIYDDGEMQSILKEVIKDLKMDEDVEIREVKSVISKYKSQGINAHTMMKKADSGYDQTMGMIFEKYEKKLKDNNAMDFDDLLGYSYKMLKEYPDILGYRQDKFKYILVDEAQDTNWIQFELMKLLTAKGSNITFIGDDYQSIYRRRGAMMENFLEVKKIWPDMEIFKLQTNYRSRPHIVQAGNHIIKNNKKQYEKNVVAHREGNDRIMVFTHSSEAEEAANNIQLLQKIKDDKNKMRGDVAILYRTNAQSAPFEQLFLQEGIPYKVYGGFKFFERREVKDIISYLKFFLNPRDTVALKRIINTPKRKIGPDTVDKIEQYSKENNIVLYDVFARLETYPIVIGPAAKSAIKQFMTSMEFLGQCLDTTAPSVFINQIVTSIRYKDYLLESEGKDVGQEKYENIGQLINIASKFDPRSVGDQVANGKELLGQFLEEISLLTDLEENAGQGSDAVQLMTIHSSKGLEFPIVFVVGLEESVFPLGNAAYDNDAMEEERRLMYVALTRAKDHLFLSHANSRRQRGQLKYNEASRFLLELPDELTKRFDFAGGNNTTSRYAADLSATAQFDVGDMVFHKLFGKGSVREVRNNMIVVQFSNPKFGLRKMDAKFVKKA